MGHRHHGRDDQRRLIWYTIHNTQHSMKSVHNGCFFVNDTAANDPICQQVMASYLEQVQRDAMRSKAIREGRIPAPEGQWGNWHISDRD